MKEAGAESLGFQLLNRNVDQPLKYVATWLIAQWSKIGLHVTQRLVPDGPWFDAMRSGNFDVVLETNGHGLANPPLDVHKYLPPYPVRELRPGPVEALPPEQFVADSPLEENGFQRSVPRRLAGADSVGAFVRP